MSLFSDVDWAILLLAGGLLLLGGGQGREVFRTIGRLYGKFLRLQQELLFELQSSASTVLEQPKPLGPHGAPPPVDPLAIAAAAAAVAPGAILPVVAAPSKSAPGAPSPIGGPVPSARGASAPPEEPSESDPREVHTGTRFTSEGPEMHR